MTRTRYTYSLGSVGTIERFGTVYRNEPPVIDESTCVDQVGPGDCGFFQVDRITGSGGLINNIDKANKSYFRPYAENYVCAAIVAAGKASYPFVSSFPGEKSSAEYALEILARTNISRPYVDVPVFLFEMAELPLLVKKAGADMIKNHASDWLWLNFGLAPIIRDAQKLVKFTETVHKRIEEFERLKGPTGLRRTIDLDSLTNTVSNNIVMNSFMVYVERQCETIAKREIRGHARYVPGVDFSKINQREMVALAKRAVLGITVDPSTLWEAMPWSWLVDWFTNMSEFLKAHRNLIPATCIGTWLMRHTTCDSRTEPWSSTEHRLDATHVTKERKERYYVSSSLPTLHLEFLTPSQWGILTSLAIVKGKK